MVARKAVLKMRYLYFGNIIHSSRQVRSQTAQWVIFLCAAVLRILAIRRLRLETVT